MVFAIMAAASLWLLFLIFFGDNGVLELHQKHQDLDQLIEANQQLSKENIQKSRIVGRLHNDPAYIENVARKELGMVREDEYIFTFSSDKESRQP
jgi:cell division protein FtsB